MQMANNKTIKRAVENVVGSAVRRGEGFDKKFNLKCKKEIREDIKVYDLYQDEELVYTVAIASDWEYSEVVFVENETTKTMQKEVLERIEESRKYGFMDI